MRGFGHVLVPGEKSSAGASRMKPKASASQVSRSLKSEITYHLPAVLVREVDPGYA